MSPSYNREGEQPPTSLPREIPAMAIGSPKDPEIAALLTEMGDVWRAHGVDTNLITPVEFTRMRKAPGQPVAIPTRASWPRTARFLREVYQPLRRAFGRPLQILNGYRQIDYNAAVKGADDSLHVDALAIDAIPLGSSGKDRERRRLALELSRFYLQYGDAYDMGIGVYDNSWSVHFDAFNPDPSRARRPIAGWKGAEVTRDFLDEARRVG